MNISSELTQKCRGTYGTITDGLGLIDHAILLADFLVDALEDPARIEDTARIAVDRPVLMILNVAKEVSLLIRQQTIKVEEIVWI